MFCSQVAAILFHRAYLYAYTELLLALDSNIVVFPRRRETANPPVDVQKNLFTLRILHQMRPRNLAAMETKRHWAQ